MHLRFCCYSVYTYSIVEQTNVTFCGLKEVLWKGEIILKANACICSRCLCCYRQEFAHINSHISATKVVSNIYISSLPEPWTLTWITAWLHPSYPQNLYLYYLLVHVLCMLQHTRGTTDHNTHCSIGFRCIAVHSHGSDDFLDNHKEKVGNQNNFVKHYKQGTSTKFALQHFPSVSFFKTWANMFPADPSEC